MRYIQVPAHAVILNPLTLEVNEVRQPDGSTAKDAPYPFVLACRLAITNIVQDNKEHVPALVLLQLKEKLNNVLPGHWLELDDKEYAILEKAFSTTAGWQPAYILNALSHVRAVLDARQSKPEVLRQDLHAPVSAPPVEDTELRN